MRPALAVAAVVAGLAGGSAWAQSGAGAVRCWLAATPLMFGHYSARRAGPADFTAMLALTCVSLSGQSAPVRASIALVGGRGGIWGRRMAHAASGLRYQLYADAAHTVVWGDGTGGSTVVSVTGVAARGNPFHQRLIVYGRLLGRQAGARAGIYTDFVAVRLSY